MRRSLSYYWRTHLAVICGAAVATAVLTGALLVGDSVRGSLRALTLERLGEIDLALIGERPFGVELTERLEEELSRQLSFSPVLMLRGSAIHGESRARASEVSLLGIGPGFSALYPERPPIDFESGERTVFPPVVLNRALADELGAAVGEQVLLSFERPAEIPRETLIGRQDAAEAIRVLRLAVVGIVDNRGPGGFALTPHQTRTFNAFLELPRLQRALFGREDSERVNLLLATTAGGETPALERLEEALTARLEIDDIGLQVRGEGQHLTVLSREFVLRPALGEALTSFAGERQAASQPVLTYLANAISSGERSVPYSTVSALDPPGSESLGPFQLIDGTPAPQLADDEILLNQWTADDLQVEAGAEIELTYFIVGDRDELSVQSRRFRLRGVLAMEGLAVDPNLTPEFPGIHEADDISAWDPPFPVALNTIRDRDEEYWDSYRSAPKAFVSESVGRRLWRSRFGDLTSIRLAPAEGGSTSELRAEMDRGLAPHLDLASVGFSFRPLKEEGLRGSKGATDFAGLFLALSMFLIAAAAMLVGLLFRLGIEQRAREVGLLRSVGYPASKVRRGLLAEGGLLAIVGASFGLVLALLYAWLMLVGLRTWWLPAVGTPVLFLHAEPLSLILGWTGSVAVVLFSVWWSLRKLHRIAPPALLAGSTAAAESASRPRRARTVAIVCLAIAGLLLVWTLVAGSADAAGPAFGIGACVLVGGLAWFSYRIGGGRRRANSLGSMAAIGMGARNSGRNRGRSLLSAALVASACFIIVVVAANRVGHEIDVMDPASGAGGFSLIAESGVALVTDLNRPDRRQDLGFSAEDSARLEDFQIVPLRLLPGEDISCLNLYRPERPRVLGAPGELIERGGFAFQTATEKLDNPWELLQSELEPGVIPAIADNNSALWILHLGLGDDIVMEDEAGREIRLRLVGLLKRSLFQSEVLISEENFTRLFPSRSGYSVFLADPPVDRLNEVAGLLESTLEDFGFDVTGTEERIASFLAVENTYMSTFQTLGGLGLILGTLGLGIVLLRNVLERRGELATLRAFGYRRSTLSWMVLSENAALLGVGISIGTFAGLVAAAPYLISAGSHLPWASLLGTLAVVFAIGMLASILAVAGTLRVPLLPALKSD
jgi:ABC-type antimicrobial peptide transport system permease subunit